MFARSGLQFCGRERQARALVDVLWHRHRKGATGKRDCGVGGFRENKVVPSSEGFIGEDRFEGGSELGVLKGG